MYLLKANSPIFVCVTLEEALSNITHKNIMEWAKLYCAKEDWIITDSSYIRNATHNNIIIHIPTTEDFPYIIVEKNSIIKISD